MDEQKNSGNVISKTRRKRQMRDLQDLGAALTRLRSDQLARLEMPANLREAVLACRTMTKHEAVRRQLQYIGKLMRKIDCEPIAAQLEGMHAPSRRDTALFHRAEKWRGEILSDPQALERFTQAYPEADPRRLRELAATATEEREAQRAPKRYRELFQAINAILQERARQEP